MIQARDVFQVKFGRIDQAVALFAQLPQIAPSYSPLGAHYHVLTDISGPIFTLVTEYMTANLGEGEQRREARFAAPEFKEWFKQLLTVVKGGWHEFFRVEA